MTVDTERRDAPAAPARTSTPGTVSRQLRPAVRRPLLARGHLLDMDYLLVYALVVVPITVLIGGLDWLAQLGSHRVTKAAR